ncbi:NADH-ubiquinone oxidoreductase 29.9 kDa subunit [Sodiomyces alkalinus F11]|uniref:NADH-ubiquinone oxidoreductase 29.9 kDa subunit n=1 Tax=Sodiomyces alkalinus (strain CBS 110278 / VKM F-3762 / F11) TaxID=1314773 RepID=A0A3N2PJX8_SODAK|nr:NADH-ubiquinone oxidoreductase 29.9 kDa subunit [Sodiomyces alkalinus F11]ROT34825.1 NADH-ubiquinone oxidoreductase 29.9 kDa subunit [Sodiomyces alkalinus F11]
MRTTLRLLANVRQAWYLEPGTPTGLTGLWTHNNPRSALLYIYSNTLEKLKSFPESSLYRQSVESFTKHRLAIVEGMTPPGYDAWKTETNELSRILDNNPEGFRVASGRVDGSEAKIVKLGNKTFVVRRQHEEGDIRLEEWDGEADEGPGTEGLRTEEERANLRVLAERKDLRDVSPLQWKEEPQLTADQISKLETKLGAGLIEEVIQVAEGELQLVDTMLKARVWEELEEKPAGDQWIYSERDSQ